MEICVLGPLHVQAGGVRAALPHRRVRAVMACLAARPRRPVRADEVAEDVWGDEAPFGAETTVRSYVARLRRALTPVTSGRPVTDVVATRDGGYLLDVEDGQLDWLRFAADVEQGSSLLAGGRARQAAQTLDRALASWRGVPFADIQASARGRELTAWLEQLRLRALEDVGEAMLLTGDQERLVPRLAALVVEHPLEERLWEQLVLALLGCGRRAEALTAYQRAGDTLLAEIGVEPGPRLRAAYSLARRGEGAAASSEPPRQRGRPPPDDHRTPRTDRRGGDRRGPAEPPRDLRQVLTGR